MSGLANHRKEFEFYFECDRKPLENNFFELVSDLFTFVF